MLSLVDRYIIGRFLVFFVSGLAVFLTLFITVDSMTTVVKYAAPAHVIIRYYLYSMPFLIYQLMPVACLAGTVFCLSSLSRSNEMTALFSVGYSLARLSLPIMILVGLFSALNFVSSDRLLPIFNQRKNYIYYVELEKTPHLYSTVKTGKIWYRSNNILFNIKSLNPEKKTAQGLTMYYFAENWDLVQMVSASQVEMGDKVWKLLDGSVTLFIDKFPVASDFKMKNVVMGEEVNDLHQSAQTADILSVRELRKFINRNKSAGLDTMSLEVDYHAKFGFAFASFVMSLIGIPFSVGKARSGGLMVNAGLCFAVTFLYWSLYSSGITLGKHGYIPPIVAAWLPNMVMTLFSFIFLLRLRK